MRFKTRVSLPCVKESGDIDAKFLPVLQQWKRSNTIEAGPGARPP
jgi:ubiquitin-protein ligase